MTRLSVPTYDFGDRRKLVIKVYNELGTLADPEELVFTIRTPDDTLTTYALGNDALIHDTTGIYHVYWDCTQYGMHYWRYAVIGDIMGAEERAFRVRHSVVLEGFGYG